MYTVYMHINKINKKKYIGITGQKPEDRWKNGTGYKIGSHFRNAIEKYGWENFDHIIIYDNLTKEQACEIEIKLIKQYNTANRLYGYNNSTGGEINFTFKHSEETKRKMSEAAKLRNHDIQIQAMKKKNMKSVICIETGIIYESASEAARQLKIKNHISEVCCGKRKTCGGYHWKFICE